MALHRPVVVATADREAHYHRAVYDGMPTLVSDISTPEPLRTNPYDEKAMSAFTQQIDVFHLHWPEWLHEIEDPEGHRAFIDGLVKADVPIVWTQHNLEPHRRPKHGPMIYQMWASAASLAIHHSTSGQQLVRSRYDFGADTRHAIIRHPNFMLQAQTTPVRTRDEAAKGLKLSPAGLRLMLIGAPRAEKDIQLAIDAVHASARPDIQLVVYGQGEAVAPHDRRILAYPYRGVNRTIYNDRLYAADALVMPFKPGMLATGTAGDAIAFGLPVISSSWQYLREALGAAAIPYGETCEDLTRLLDTITPERLKVSAKAAVRCQGPTSTDTIGAATAYELGRVLGVDLEVSRNHESLTG